MFSLARTLLQPSRALLQSSRAALHMLSPSSTTLSPPPATRFSPVRCYSDAPPPLDMPAIEARVLQLLRDFEKVSKSKVTVDAHFINDLGLDSLDQVEITMGLEDEFNIELSDKDAEEIFTVKQAVEKIYANKSAM